MYRGLSILKYFFTVNEDDLYIDIIWLCSNTVPKKKKYTFIFKLFYSLLSISNRNFFSSLPWVLFLKENTTRNIISQFKKKQISLMYFFFKVNEFSFFLLNCTVLNNKRTESTSEVRACFN